MIWRTLFSLLLICSITSCATAQVYTFKATVQQPAGSVIKPDAIPDSTLALSVDNQPLYSSDDILLYLPAPANLGFFVDDDSTDIIILGPRFGKGQSLWLQPIGLMEFNNGNDMINKVLAIPADPALQVIKSPTLEQLQLNYPGVIDILTTWFENAFDDRQLRFTDLKDEREAVQFLKQRKPW